MQICKKWSWIIGVNCDRDFVRVCVVTLHSCPILAMVALPVCSPSMAFSLKNRKILSSSGLSLSGIKFTPMNLGSRGKKRMNKARELHCTQKNMHICWYTLESHTTVHKCNFTIKPLPEWQSFHPYFTPPKPIPHDILQSRLSNNSHSLYTLVLQYLTLLHVSAPSPNPT